MNEITKVRIRGIEVEFNWFDMESREKYAAANDTLQAELEALDHQWEAIEDPTEAQEIAHFKAICTAVHEMFKSLFGEVITEKIFKGKYDYFACMDAIASLVSAKEKQAKVIESIASSPKMSDPVN
jgi:NDP-sugar pyrophosphorylase family protein